MGRASVLLAVCALASAVSAAQPAFGPSDIPRRLGSARLPPQTFNRCRPGLDDEFLIDTTITRIPVPGYQSAPALAFDGTNFLVVWEDWRRANSDIYGARVTPAGVVLDPDGIPISIAGNDQSSPAVAFDGTNFVVFWEDWRSDTADIYGARVTQTGVVLDSDGIAVSAAANTQRSPTVAFDGTNFLVVWQDDRKSRDTFDVYGSRVDGTGTSLDSAGIPLSTATGDQVYPAACFDGTNFLVAWQDSRNGNHCDIYGARLTQTGTVLDPGGLAISTAANYQQFPSVAFDGTSFLVAWQDFRGIGDYSHIYGARVTQAGTLLDTGGFSISPTDYDQKSPAIAFNGTDYLVVWEDWRGSSYYDVYGARVTPAAVVLEPDGIVISQQADAEYLPAVATGDSDFLVAWQDFRGRSADIYAGRVTPTGSVLDPDGIPVAIAANDQSSPAAAFDGANYLVVWEDWRNGPELDLYGARVTPAGVVLDPSGFAISQAARDQKDPAVAFDGTNYLVVWADHRSGDSVATYGARVTPAGVVLDSSGIAISTAAGDQWSPAVAFDGTNYLVVWSDNRGGYEWDIYGVRVTPAGEVPDAADIAISTATGHQQFVALAFDGTSYLVAWADTRSGLCDLYGARVTPQGSVLDPSGIAISTARSSQRYPAVGSDSTNYLVVWVDRRGADADIYGARVTPAGTVLDPNGVVVSQAAGDQCNPVLGYDQTSFLAAWEDCRSDSSDIYAARVRPDGTVFDEGPVVRQASSQVCPALARGSGNDLFLAYQGWAGAVGGNTYNTNRIWGKMNPSPGIADKRKVAVRTSRPFPSIVHSVLFVPPSLLTTTACLLSIDGCKALELRPGTNDVRGLSPGVYFVHPAAGMERGTAGGMKIVVTR